jgi:hypothetical protein
MAAAGGTVHVWIVTEEIEVGSLADGSTYTVLSVHSTEDGAQAEVDQWFTEHDCDAPEGERNRGGGGGWCGCGRAAVFDGPIDVSRP